MCRLCIGCENMKRALLIVVNIILLVLIAFPVVRSKTGSISTESYYYHDTLVLKEAYSAELTNVPKGSVVEVRYIRNDGVATCYISNDEGVSVEIPFSCFEEEVDMYRVLEEKRTDAIKRIRKIYIQMITRIAVSVVIMVVGSLVFYKIMGKNCHCEEIYSILTILLLLVVINDYWVEYFSRLF